MLRGLLRGEHIFEEVTAHQDTGQANCIVLHEVRGVSGRLLPITFSDWGLALLPPAFGGSRRSMSPLGLLPPRFLNERISLVQSNGEVLFRDCRQPPQHVGGSWSHPYRVTPLSPIFGAVQTRSPVDFGDQPAPISVSVFRL